ncbi:hypothetical protein SKAU_G00059630 [Synaphobranchus kaupii]|uniref:Uncharacterized protein n=1 Tax=Synaphobranchus kaupii TaxID=118154 RepID=A0A9Q1G4J4_SYNKA|nr:hypothetical protein SKAU_G00059630 [Synaphobranchus kaupii]
MFRAAILEGLPELAKSRLEEVVGLSSKPHREFVYHVIHAVERCRLEEKKQSNQEREVQRKLFQMQLEDMKSKEKNRNKEKEKEKDPKKMAPIMADFMWEEPEPSRPERGRGPSGSQPTVVYNFAGVPPPAFPTPVYIQGAAQGAPPQIGDKGTKGGLGTNQGIEGKGIRTGDKDRGVINNISNSSTFRQGQVSRCHSSNRNSIREDFQDPGFQYSLKVL